MAEGGAQGTGVCPAAACKSCLSADEQVRARRRHRDLLGRGEESPFEGVLANQRLRDERDLSRAVGALRMADDAIEVSTDGLSPDEVVARLEAIVRSKQSA